MGRLLLSSALLMAMASTAAAQSSGTVPGATNAPATGVTAGLPLAGNRASTCTADNACASFPLTPPSATPLGTANPSLAPRLSPGLSPSIGTPANGTGGAIAAAPAGAPLNQTGSLNPTGAFNQTEGALTQGALNEAPGAIASPGIGGALNQPGGLNRAGSAGARAATGAAAGRTGSTPAGRSPSLSSNSFEAQCANSPSCRGFEGQ